jgi:hypothetical protein
MCKQYSEDFKANQEEFMSEAQLGRYNQMMTKTVAQQRGYPGVNMLAGNGDARGGMPAASVVEMYKTQLAEEVRVYNETYLGE